MKSNQEQRRGVQLIMTLCFSILFFSWIFLAGSVDKIDPFIFEEIANNSQTRFIVHMKDKADLSNAAFIQEWKKRGDYVYHFLTAKASESQAPLVDLINRKNEAGSSLEYTSYWICNCLAVTGDRETLLEIAQREDVEKIVANRELQVIDPVEPVEAAGAADTVEWNIAQIRANQVWSTYGITGDGITIGDMDTGVDWTHPALQSKYRGWNSGQPDHNYNWFDAVSGRRDPYDSEGHGTHTMGTIVGDDGGGNQIGVAPGANWIAVLIIAPPYTTWIEAAHRGFQWMLAPTDLDGQNPDPSLRPSVVNNSWGCAGGIVGCSGYEEFRDDVNAWISGGIFPEFSAGNEGPSARSLRWPGDYHEAFATGATDRNDRIVGFSSRGPSRDDGGVKPNVTAPGLDVRSSIPGGRYGSMSGTSMAGPHVVGLVALLLEANPNLSIDELEELIQSTAVPLGGPRPNNDYGWGRIDALAAVGSALRLK